MCIRSFELTSKGALPWDRGGEMPARGNGNQEEKEMGMTATCVCMFPYVCACMSEHVCACTAYRLGQQARPWFFSCLVQA